MSGKKFNFSWPPGCGRVPPKVVQACMTQESHFYLAHRQSAERDHAFMEMLTGPPPLTPEEVDLMCDLRPDKYERYRGFGARAKAKKKEEGPVSE